MHQKGISLFSVETFFVSVPKNFVEEPLQCFRKFRASKIFMNRRGGHHGVVKESFVSQDRKEKLGKGTLLFSIKVLVSKKFYG